MTSESGTLYVVGTPLGNLADLSPRAADVLRAVDLVAAEDTRRTRILLDHVGARPRVTSFHAHSPPSRLTTLCARLADGRDIALVTDAGTPTISDPGSALVRAAHDVGARVVTIPGPTAVAAALSVSGLPADRHLFLGFLPRKGRDRRRLLEAIAESAWCVVVFESAPRLARLLDDLAAVAGDDRDAVVTRELTKVHEEVRRGTLANLAGYYREAPPKGEITLVVAGRPASVKTVDDAAIRDRARVLLRAGESRRDVAARVAAELSVSKKEAYRVVTSL